MYIENVVKVLVCYHYFFQAEDGIRDKLVTGVQTCALPIFERSRSHVSTTTHTATGAGTLSTTRRRRTGRRSTCRRSTCRRRTTRSSTGSTATGTAALSTSHLLVDGDCLVGLRDRPDDTIHALDSLTETLALALIKRPGSGEAGRRRSMHGQREYKCADQTKSAKQLSH